MRIRRHSRTTTRYAQAPCPDLPVPVRFPVAWEPQLTIVWYSSGRRNVYTAGIEINGSPTLLRDAERSIQDLADLVRGAGVAVSLDSPTIRRTVD